MEHNLDVKIQNSATSTQTHKIDQCLVSLSSQEEKLSDGGRFSATSSIMGSFTSPPPCSALIGDYIGVESCLDLKNNYDIFTSSSKVENSQGFSQRRSKRDQRCAMKEFPPPMPSLARTGNLSSHMPWVLRRHYTEDGRLIIREERVKHHEYFQAHRCNGRLTLKLVPLDDEVYSPYRQGYADDLDDSENESEYSHEEVKNELENRQIEEEEEQEEKDETGNCSNEEVKNELENFCSEEEKEDKKETGIIDQCNDIQVNENGRDDEYDDGVNYFQSCNGIIVKDILYEDQRVPSAETGIGGNLSAFKCLNIYNSVRPGSSCIFGVPLPAMRPVHG
ncbi:uncharacterized protein LOC110640884 isoform X2 [Hevea brasiliensis]|uniref:uncharacterized protein LOC110640884 isoform X2 n=1 Tax=Hevea brasiliensis TaxID=3981 RepID=UPI000B793CD1|nr:uncharacterized protein LOC110640884 isoform X2 [Hevea brasiliensis]XP_021648107.1 uncharacterized protein LOC110640884 isoform X2 [Hevea brasiliensis]XP_057994524.1 uncharacterized protein LOC110640884 isoform X2 [Hevea brasiliensis]